MKPSGRNPAGDVTIESDDTIGETAQRLIHDLCAEMSARYGAPPSPFSFAEASAPRTAFLVARWRGEPVGCGTLRRLDDYTAEIKRMYVAPASRRRGIARWILAELERSAREFNYRVIRLETGVRQPEAQRLYESMGFRRIATFGPYVGNPSSVCFEKEVTDSTHSGRTIERQCMKTPASICIRPVINEPAIPEALADVLLDCVEGGASIGFMHPLARAKAVGFWEGVVASAGRGERILLVAEDVENNTIVGTVQVVLNMPDNQPHRADIAKMQVHRRARRRGVGAALMRAAETAALEAGRTLLVLDTVTGSDAERLYTRLGWQRCGDIPGYALWPHGGFCSTTVFYRVLTQEAAQCFPESTISRSPQTDRAASSRDIHGDAVSIEVIGIDHIYIAVSDLARSEAFYDLVMGILGFRKNTFPNDGDHHIQYYNRHFGFVLRPAHSGQRVHDSLAPGLHHFCFRVEDPAAVDTIARRFAELGVICSSPQLYPEYAPDYYAIFFTDPDGIRLEVTNYRQERRKRHDDWEHA